MRIKSLLNLSSYVSIAAVLFMITAFTWLNFQTARTEGNRILSGEMLSCIYERTVLRDEYFIYGEERSLIQSRSKTVELGKLFERALNGFSEKDKATLAEMHETYQETITIFSLLVQTNENINSGKLDGTLADEYRNRLFSQLLFKEYVLSGSAAGLLDSLNEDATVTSHWATLLLVLCAVLIAATVLVNGSVIGRILKKRIGQVRKGAEIIGKGDLDYRIDATGRDEIADLAREINGMSTKLKNSYKLLEASNRELEAFSYSVSHDLRAPLRHISGYVNLLNERFYQALEGKGKHYLDSITDSIHQMGLLIDNLLDFSRTGRVEMRIAGVDMNDIVHQVVEPLCQDHPERCIEWSIGVLPPVVGDIAMLKLVWLNLLENAVKFTRTREKAIIEVGVEEAEGEIIFFVRDNGSGFDMQYSQKLFGVFQRLHSTEEFEGTGIGLANVRRIITRHGGRTWAQAQPDKGAVFYFSIPKQQEEL